MNIHVKTEMYIFNIAFKILNYKIYKVDPYFEVYTLKGKLKCVGSRWWLRELGYIFLMSSLVPPGFNPTTRIKTKKKFFTPFFR